MQTDRDANLRYKKSIGIDHKTGEMMEALETVTGRNISLVRNHREHTRLQSLMSGKNSWNRENKTPMKIYLDNYDPKSKLVEARYTLAEISYSRKMDKLRKTRMNGRKLVEDALNNMRLEIGIALAKISDKDLDSEGNLRTLTSIGKLIGRTSKETFDPQKQLDIDKIQGQHLLRLTGHTLRTLKNIQEIWKFMRKNEMVGHGNLPEGFEDIIEDLLQSQMAHVEQFSKFTNDSFLPTVTAEKKVKNLVTMDATAIIGAKQSNEWNGEQGRDMERASLWSGENVSAYERNFAVKLKRKGLG